MGLSCGVRMDHEQILQRQPELENGTDEIHRTKSELHAVFSPRRVSAKHGPLFQQRRAAGTQCVKAPAMHAYNSEQICWHMLLIHILGGGPPCSLSWMGYP